MIVNGYKAVSLETGKVYYAQTLKELAFQIKTYASTIGKAFRRGTNICCKHQISKCEYIIEQKEEKCDWLMKKLDGVNYCEVIEITGHKTFIIHGRYKELAINHPLAKKNVIADYIGTNGLRTLVVLRG